MLADLRELGLTGGEAKVYLSLLRLGASTVGPLVKEARVSYSKVYEVLLRLQEKGLVSYILCEKTRHYHAASPARLQDYLDRQEKVQEARARSLRDLLPKLEHLERVHPRQAAEVFVGFAGLRTAYEELLKGSKPRDELLFFYVHDAHAAKQTDLFYRQAFHLFRRLRLQLRGVTHEGFKRSKFYAGPPSFLKLRFVAFPLPSTVDIFADRILLSAWRQSPTGILVHSAELAENWRTHFEEVWKLDSL